MGRARGRRLRRDRDRRHRRRTRGGWHSEHPLLPGLVGGPGRLRFIEQIATYDDTPLFVREVEEMQRLVPDLETDWAQVPLVECVAISLDATSAWSGASLSYARYAVDDERSLAELEAQEVRTATGVLQIMVSIEHPQVQLIELGVRTGPSP